MENLEPKMMVTRKLRRRHYDPLPIPAAEKRRKSAPCILPLYMGCVVWLLCVFSASMMSLMNNEW